MADSLISVWVSLCQSPPLIFLLNQGMDFHKSVYEPYVIWRYNDAKKFNLLQ